MTTRTPLRGVCTSLIVAVHCGKRRPNPIPKFVLSLGAHWDDSTLQKQWKIYSPRGKIRTFPSVLLQLCARMFAKDCDPQFAKAAQTAVDRIEGKAVPLDDDPDGLSRGRVALALLMRKGDEVRTQMAQDYQRPYVSQPPVSIGPVEFFQVPSGVIAQFLPPVL